MPRTKRVFLSLFRSGAPLLTLSFFAISLPAAAEEIWRGITVAPEHRCTPYERDDYRYPQSVEQKVIERLEGRIYGPYTGRHFESPKASMLSRKWPTRRFHETIPAAPTATINQPRAGRNTPVVFFCRHPSPITPPIMPTFTPRSRA